MPYCEVPIEALDRLTLFGFQVLEDDGDFMLVVGDKGRMIVDKSKPFLWFDDIEDAVQIGATAIVQGP